MNQDLWKSLSFRAESLAKQPIGAAIFGQQDHSLATTPLELHIYVSVAKKITPQKQITSTQFVDCFISISILLRLVLFSIVWEEWQHGSFTRVPNLGPQLWPCEVQVMNSFSPQRNFIINIDNIQNFVHSLFPGLLHVITKQMNAGMPGIFVMNLYQTQANHQFICQKFPRSRFQKQKRDQSHSHFISG